MEHIVIKVKSNKTSLAIKDFVSWFSDASIENTSENEDNYLMKTYGINKQEFENRVNTGIAQSILGITKPWNEVGEDLLGKINKNEED